MSLSESEKHGIRLVGQSSDVTFCVPPKKRHLLWPQSPGSICPSPTTYSSNLCHQTDKDDHVKEPGLSGPGTETDTSVSESATCILPNKTVNVKRSPSHDKQEVVHTFCVTGTQEDTKGKLNREDTSKPFSDKSELPSASNNPDDLSTRNEAGEGLSNHQFKVQQVEDHDMKPSNQLLGSFTIKDSSGSANAVDKKETSNPCSDDAAVGEDILNDNYSEKTGSGVLCSDRSNWDLNTVMDSWERSFPDADQKESPAPEPRTEDICKEGFKCHSNSASILNDNFYSESYIELKLNSAIDSVTQVSQVCPDPSASLNPHGDATRLNLSMSLTCTAPSTLSANSIGNGKHFTQGLVDKMNLGKQNVNPMTLKIVKSEPCDVPVMKAAKVDVANSPKLVHNAVVKSETQIESFQNISGKAQEKDRLSESHPDPLNPPRFRHAINEKSKNVQHLVQQISVGECRSVNGLLSEVQPKGTLQTDVLQAVHLKAGMDSISTVKLELPEGSKLGMNVDTTETGCSNTGETFVNSRFALDSKHLDGTDYTGIPSESSNTVNKFASVSEFPSDVPTGNSEYAVAQSSPHKLLDSGVTGQANDCVLNRAVEVPRVGGSASSAAQSLGDKEQIDSCGSKMMVDTNNGKLLSQLFDIKPCISESLTSPRGLVPSQVTSKPPIDDDIEDGEVRDSQQAGRQILLGDSKTKNVCSDEATTSVEPVPGTATKLNETGRLNESHNFVEGNSAFSSISDNMDTENMFSSIVSEEQGPCTPKIPRSTEPCEKKPVKSEVLDHAPEDSEQLLPSKVSNESHGLPVEENAGEVDAYKVNPEESLPFPFDSKADTVSKSDGTVPISDKDGQNCLIQLNSSSKVSSFERKNTSGRKWVSPKNARERSCDQLFKGDGPHRKGNRDETCSNGPRIIKKEWNRDETSRKVGSEYVHRGRAKRTWHNDQNPDVDYVSGRFNNADSYRFPRHKNVPEMTSVVSADCAIENTDRMIRSFPMDDVDNFSRAPSRRRSPGGRDRPFGRMVRRRDISPRRCIDAADPEAVLLNREENFLPNLREHMVDAQNFAGPCSNFERGESSFMRRRSLSPIQRRGLPRLPQMCSPSSRRHPRSPCQLSPQRPPDDFDGHSEAIPPAAFWGDRTRSPHRHDLFMGDVVGRRHVSPPPYMPRLHDGMRDDNPLRAHNFARNGRPFQRNTRNFHLINTEVDGEVEYFGPPLHPGQIRELPPEENLDDGRNCNERHGLGRPLRRYNIDNACDEDFNFRIERNPPSRPVRFHAEVKEEFPERDDLHGGFRHRMGEMPRRMRAIEERVGVCQREDNQGWPDSSLGSDVRLKRRRY